MVLQLNSNFLNTGIALQLIKVCYNGPEGRYAIFREVKVNNCKKKKFC